MQYFVDEIFSQPAALSDLLGYYDHHPLPLLTTRGAEDSILLTGMGASYHAACIAAYQLQRNNVFAQAVEAIELLNYPSATLSRFQTLVYISQSGASGEVEPVFDTLPPDAATIGITNHSTSTLCQCAGLTLPLCAGVERTVATKTYVNSLALLSLLAGAAPEAFHDIVPRMTQLLDAAEQTRTLWLDTLGAMDALYFVGHGPHGITARHCAMMASEWAKRPALYAGIGAFRHGFIEAVGAGIGVVVFAPAGVSQQSAYDLADELTGYGASVLLVENGHARRPGDSPTVEPLDDELLSPLVDIIPVQVFVEALARETGFVTGFRYISKVVSQL